MLSSVRLEASVAQRAPPGLPPSMQLLAGPGVGAWGQMGRDSFLADSQLWSLHPLPCFHLPWPSPSVCCLCPPQDPGLWLGGQQDLLSPWQVPPP